MCKKFEDICNRVRRICCFLSKLFRSSRTPRYSSLHVILSQPRKVRGKKKTMKRIVLSNHLYEYWQKVIVLWLVINFV